MSREGSLRLVASLAETTGVSRCHTAARAGTLWPLAKEQFSHSATQPLFKKLEELSQRSAVSRGQAFEDWLIAMVCALAAETKEDEYLAMIERHKRGQPGHRGADLMAEMFADLVSAMTDTDADILGDVFSGAVTYNEAGQYFSPEAIARLLAEMSVDADARAPGDQPVLVNDPCCGTGRMLLEAFRINPDAHLLGQDVDARCAKISAINLGLRGAYGWVVCGNALTGEKGFAYRIGSFFNETRSGLRRGVIREVPPEATPVAAIAKRTRSDTNDLLETESGDTGESAPTLPTVIDVPQWLARLEPKLAALDRDEPAPDDAEPKPEEPRSDAPPKQQGELF